jgi:hypothetical protein
MLMLCGLLFSTQVFATSSDDWAGYWTYNKTIIVEYSNELSNLYGSTPDNTQISYSTSANKIDYRFNYTGTGYQEYLYDEALNDPEGYQYETIMQNLLLHNLKNNTEKTQPLRLTHQSTFITIKFFILTLSGFTHLLGQIFIIPVR